MMTKTDYEIVGTTLSSLPLGMRALIYRKLVRALSERDYKFDPEKFGGSMDLPTFMRVRKETQDASSQEGRRQEDSGQENHARQEDRFDEEGFDYDEEVEF